MNHSIVKTNQYSVTEQEQDLNPKSPGALPTKMPGIFFRYEISPMLAVYKEYRKPFATFLTDLCAIVGGVFTVAGMVDGAIWTAQKNMKQKLDLGKSS